MKSHTNKIVFGDFQTPSVLTDKICSYLKAHGSAPSTIVEPTCGIGNFVKSAISYFPNSSEINAYEINLNYINYASKNIKESNIKFSHKDFFNVDWQNELSEKSSPILVLGNLPWVTNSAQGFLNSENLPKKYNFLNFSGFEAVTGKANFDISEWMIIWLLNALKDKKSEIALLIKTSVARKIVSYIISNNFSPNAISIIKIDAKNYFNVSVSACLIHIKINFPEKIINKCYEYDSLESEEYKEIFYKNGFLHNVLKNNNFIGHSPQKWRSGIKHDAKKVMELTKDSNRYVNGFGDIVNIESDYIFPLLKGSDVANSRSITNRYVIVPQKKVGEDTAIIKKMAPKTWNYLLNNASILDSRKSVIYKNNPRFSIFGLGEYSFKPWKIAICGLYKKIAFSLYGPSEGKVCMFDDTVYYISFDTQEEAKNVYDILQSNKVLSLLNSLIFWDDKRPIKTSILNKIDWMKFL